MPLSRVLAAPLFAVTLALGCSMARGPEHATNPYACTEVVGLDDIALSFDGGKTLVQSRRPGNYHELTALVSLGTPYQLAALIDHGGGVEELFVSPDGGCHWENREDIPKLTIGEGRDGLAHAWGRGLYAISKRGARPLRAPTEDVVGLAVDASNSRHLRLVGKDASLASAAVFDSTDGGVSWKKTADVKPTSALDQPPTSVEFDPQNLDRIVAVRGDQPPIVSHDGGLHWATSTGCVKCTRIFFSRHGQFVWALGRQLLRSTDGGVGFDPVADPFPHDMVVVVGAQLDPNILALAGSTTLSLMDFRSFASTRQELPLRERGTSTSIPRVRAATYVPGAPSVLCLGINRNPRGDDGPM